ncbi:hypothetical protein OH77DRAFT_1499333 [Trametes cingulata]|nr:hypothetical protein OH77DRAFT_1499333 [Trametes cingulata]
MFALLAPVLAQVEDVDDANPGMFYTGLWIPDGDPLTFGSHQAWTNQSGASVSFDFIGTQIKLFVSRRPVGTYLSNASFSIDGGTPAFWTTSEPVDTLSYRNLVYTSRSLSPTQHRVTVTNFGAFFWFDYMEFTVASQPPGGNPTTEATPRVSASSTANTTQAPASTSTSITSVSTSAPIAHETSSTTSVTQTSAVVSITAAAGKSSHTGMIVGIVVGVLGGMALLFAALWWLRMRVQARRAAESSTITPFGASDHPLAVPSPSAALSGKDRSPGSASPMAQYGALPLPTVPYTPALEHGESGYPSTTRYSATRPYDEPEDPHVTKQLALFRAHEASPNPIPYRELSTCVLEPAHARAADPELLLEAIPAERVLPPGDDSEAADVSGAPEMAPPSTGAQPSRTMPVSRPSWLTRALLMSSSSTRNHGTPNTTPTQSSTARASSSDSAAGPTPGSSSYRPPYLCAFRRSRDGGIRLAGGRPDEQNAQMWTPAAYDDVVAALSSSSRCPRPTRSTRARDEGCRRW